MKKVIFRKTTLFLLFAFLGMSWGNTVSAQLHFKKMCDMSLESSNVSPKPMGDLTGDDLADYLRVFNNQYSSTHFLFYRNTYPVLNEPYANYSSYWIEDTMVFENIDPIINEFSVESNYIFDADDDGDNDVLLTFSHDNYKRAMVLKNDGAGVFSIGDSISIPNMVVPISFFDINKDGKKELLYGYTSGSYNSTTLDSTAGFISCGNGTLKFESYVYEIPRGSYVKIANNQESYIQSGDFNGDNILDMVSIQGFTVTIFEGIEGGGYTKKTAYEAGSSDLEFVLPHVYDLDNDGTDEIYFSSKKVIWENNTYIMSNILEYNSGVFKAAQDFNKDGKLDLILQDGYDQEKYFEQNENGDFLIKSYFKADYSSAPSMPGFDVFNQGFEVVFINGEVYQAKEAEPINIYLTSFNDTIDHGFINFYNGNKLMVNSETKVAKGALLPGKHYYNASAEGYMSIYDNYTGYPDSIEVVEGADNIFSIDLKKLYNVTFRFIDSDSNAVEGVWVYSDNMAHLMSSLPSDADGILVTEFPAGKSGFRIEANGYPTIEVNKDDIDALNITSDVTIDYMMKKARTVTLKVKSSFNQNTMLSGAVLTINNNTYTSNDQGEILIESILQGTYGFTATYANYIPLNVSYNAPNAITVTDDQEVIEVFMNKACAVTFELKTADATPVEGAVIAFNNENVITDANGQAVFDTITAGKTYAYSITKGVNLPMSGDVELADQDILQSVTFIEKEAPERLFIPYSKTAFGQELYKYVANDFDADGDVDIYALCDSGFVCFKNDGKAHFTMENQDWFDWGVADLKMGHFNDDDLMDLAIRCYDVYHGTEIFYNQGNGVFNKESTESAYYYSQDVIGEEIVVGDYDGNGFDDVFVSGIASNNNNSQLYLNNNGSFSNAGEFMHPYYSYPADFNNDSIDEIFFGGGKLYVPRDPLVGVGGILYDKPAGIYGKDGIKGTISLLENLNITGFNVADYTNDSVNDIFVTTFVYNHGSYPHEEYHCYLLEGPNFGIVDSMAVDSNAQYIATLDLNNDGYLDIVDRNNLWCNNGSGKFTKDTTGIATLISGYASDLLVEKNQVTQADFNGDGYEDILLNGTIHLFKSITNTLTFNVASGSGNLEGATVIIANQSVETNADGNVDVKLPNGFYTYEVSYNENKVTGEITVENEDLTEEVNITIIGVEANNTIEEPFVLYPNPASDWFIIETDCSNYQFSILNMVGAKITTCKASNNKKVSTMDLMPGLYFIVIERDSFTNTYKLLVE